MRSPKSVFLVLAVSMRIAAQTSEPATVEGVVALSGSTERVPSAVVSFVNATGGERRVTSGSDGKFTIGTLQPGHYKITVTKPGYLPPPDGSGQVEVDLISSQHRTDIILQILRGGVVSGRLTDESRYPRSNLRVDLTRYRYIAGQRTLAMTGTTVTDDRGEFRFSGLEPGEYLIRIVGTIDGQALSPTFYPGVSKVESAVPVTVKAGMETNGVNFSLSPDMTHTVKVHVSAPAERAVTVVLNSKNPADLPLSVLLQPDARGAYVFEKVQRGSYFLFAHTLESKGTLSGRMPIVVADEDVDAGTLLLQPGHQVVGRISSENALPAGFAFQRLRVSFAVVEGSSRLMPPPIMPNEDGGFAVPDVPAGTYRVSITGLPETVFFESVLYETRTLPDLTFVLERDAGPLELRINGPAGTVLGTVRNTVNGVVPNAEVVLIPSAGRRSNPEIFRVASTDQNGKFTMRGVAPDEYQVLAWEKFTAGAYQNSDFLRPYESRAAKVTVTRGSVHDLNLSVIAAGQ